MARLAIIGAGNMGAAIAHGLLDTHTLAPSNLIIVNPSSDKLAPFADKGAHTLTSATELAALAPDTVLLAVKPQIIDRVAASLAGALEHALVISIAAGITLKQLSSYVGHERIVRVMPNLGVACELGASAICGGAGATAEDVALVQQLFEALGTCAVMREDQLEVEAAAVGCAPAFFALMVDALTRAAVKEGLPAADARRLVTTTMAGTAKALMTKDIHPRAYMEQVTSPGGTTAAALYELEPLLTEGSYAAVEAALARSRELSDSK